MVLITKMRTQDPQSVHEFQIVELVHRLILIIFPLLRILLPKQGKQVAQRLK